MAISDIPIFSMLRTRMQWHQERQRLLAENVSNADTPKFKPRDLAPLSFERPEPRPVALATTDAAHLAGLSGGERFRDKPERFAVRPGGNAVQIEDEMLKVASNQMDYQAATQLYSRSLALLKTAIGK
ncbi:flagellar basal body rod protein FlgB [Rhodoplanes sp. TEM]|uniref:Flagellar basal body rod protein FlgB n=1 Tax=Rhodoplanes tepidamans TaxID=200616 RepID=A0ABT5J7C0_RHOTP|nr:MULTISPECIES: flagellar basal body rod protein FlgB [Rhodoplanes]MDC7785519.1 flagellar basal body rod protein FlgB [Rhodoplanes tepidamans]MDC7986136.1 flagellar basal body rod protein FlgB [Rhodoplanes sp. TEM]MDQ0353311.1 flagellar basal-body rod protein FlgB [Rhodoplanes tepidamans]